MQKVLKTITNKFENVIWKIKQNQYGLYPKSPKLALDLICCIIGLPRWCSGKEPVCQCKRPGFNPWVREDILEKEMAAHSRILAGKSYGQRILAGCSPWGCKRVGYDWATKYHHHHHIIILNINYHMIISRYAATKTFWEIWRYPDD